MLRVAERTPGLIGLSLLTITGKKHHEAVVQRKLLYAMSEAVGCTMIDAPVLKPRRIVFKENWTRHRDSDKGQRTHNQASSVFTDFWYDGSLLTAVSVCFAKMDHRKVRKKPLEHLTRFTTTKDTRHYCCQATLQRLYGPYLPKMKWSFTSSNDFSSVSVPHQDLIRRLISF